MDIALKEILNSTVFKSSKVLAGEAGLDRKIGRVSVFDCPWNLSAINKNIIEKGDLFITCLEQFSGGKAGAEEYVDNLIASGSAGLIVVTAESVGALTPPILKKCSDEAFPVILLEEDIPYAVIMDTINKYIALEMQNSLTVLKLEKILYGRVSPKEKLETLHSINPDMGEFIRAIYVEGVFKSDISQSEIYMEYMNKKNAILVRKGSYNIFILAADSEKVLRAFTDATMAKFKSLIDSHQVGYSRIYPRKEVARAMEEALRAFETAKSMNMDFMEYNPLSVLQLLISVRDTKEAADFYQAYVSKIKEKVSGDNLKEILHTMECYVACSGDFKETASRLYQHENTIRYRVNKVKNALEMDNDNIKFNETLAIAVKLRTILNEEI
ncbi:MAG: PucR family transcriptional regulator [Anaerovoracaceae bacterium]